MRGCDLHLMTQLNGIDRLAGFLANQQFGQCWWSRQTANMTHQYAVGAHQHARILLRCTMKHHAATCCPRANGARLPSVGCGQRMAGFEIMGPTASLISHTTSTRSGGSAKK